MSGSCTFKKVGDVTFFLPPAGMTESAEFRELLRSNAEANQRFIDASSGAAPRRIITGSFIYAHPPNYVGIPAYRFSKDDWSRELTRLKTLGIDTLIFQASAWYGMEECYYPSTLFSTFRQWNVVEPMLDAANELDFTVFLGGYGSATCWREQLDAGTVDEEISRQYGCFKELYQLYGDKFHGFYFTPESAFSGVRDLELESHLASIYSGLFNLIRRSDPKLQIMMSPATKYYSGEALQDMEAAWSMMFSQAHPDILAPQDSIGAGCITLDKQDEAYQVWQKLCRKYGIRLWANIEAFDWAEPYNDENSRRAAAPERMICQINNAAPYAEKLISWEAFYYTSPTAHAQGQYMTQLIYKENNGIR